MFSRNKAPTVPPLASRPTYCWEKQNDSAQQLWVQVKSLDYKLFPTMTHDGPPRRIFQWQGRVHAPGFEQVLAIGEIEALEPEDLPRSSSDLWDKVPSVYNGRGCLHSNENKIDDAFFGFDLYCRPGVFHEVARVFTACVGPAHGALGLKVTITHPDHPEGGNNYWNTEWRADSWQVLSWEVFAGATAEGYNRQ